MQHILSKMRKAIEESEVWHFFNKKIFISIGNALFFCKIFLFSLAYLPYLWYYMYENGGKQMRLKITKTKSATNYYIIKDIKKNGKRSTAIYERLGTEKEILKRSNVFYVLIAQQDRAVAS